MGVATQLQDVLVARLAADTMFNGSQSANGEPIPVIKEIKGDLNNSINISLSKLGVCAVAMVPMFRLFNWQVPSTGGWMIQKINVFEDTTLNQSLANISAVDLCERIVSLMHYYPSGLTLPDGSPAQQAGAPSQFWAQEVPWEFIGLGPELEVGQPLQYVVSLQVNTALPPPTG
jgi:hypothetical protein